MICEEPPSLGVGHSVCPDLLRDLSHPELAGEEAAEPARLICMHGLSRRPLVLPPSELLASNAQLTQMKQGVNTKRWVVKEGGVRLARRVLLLAAPRSLPVCLT